MESSVNLLRLAVYENDDHLRTEQVVKACKMITDILPFDRKNSVLIEEPELMKYLMLSIPLNPRVIDMIISSMINKFKKLHYFLKELWLGFIAVAELEEPGDRHIVKSQTALRHFQHNVKKVLKILTLKDLDDVPRAHSARASEYCNEINKKKNLIKLAVLDYFERVIEIYTKDVNSNSIAFKPDITDLIKKFILHTSNDKVIYKVCTIMEKASFGVKSSVANHEIEEMVLNKQSMLASDPNKYPSKTSLDENVKPSKPINHVKGKLASITELSQHVGEDSIYTLRSNIETPKRMAVDSRSDIQKRMREDRTPKGGDMVYSQVDEFDGLTSVEARLDYWLSWGDLVEIPLISKNSYIYNTLKNPGYFEVMLSFVFDPQNFPIGECVSYLLSRFSNLTKWKSKCPMVDLDVSNTLSQQSPTLPLPCLNFQKLKDDRGLQPYMMRSFRAMQVLCDARNMKILAQTNDRVFDNFFKVSFLYVSLSNREELCCNFNHIAKITEYLLLHEPEICANYLIFYNLPYKFILNCDFPCIQEFFLTLFSCSYNSHKISEEAYVKILKYCEIVSFFSDTAEAILLGPKALDNKKWEIEYKPPGVESLVHGAIKDDDLEGLFEEKPISYANESVNPLLDEELNGLNLDIDNLCPIMNSDLKSNRKRVESDQKSKKRALSEKIIKRYASLREKYHPKDDIMRDLNEDEFKVPTNIDQTNEQRSTKSIADADSTTGDVIIRSQKSTVQLGRGKSNVIIHKKSGDFYLHGSPQNPKGFGISNSNNITAVQNSLALQSNLQSIDNDRSSLNQSHYETRMKSTDGKMLRHLSTFGKREDSLRMQKTFNTGSRISDDLGSNSLYHIKDQNYSSQALGSKHNLGKTIKEFYSAAPQKITLAQEFLTDVMTTEQAEQLNTLYPINNAVRIETEIDKEAKRKEFTISGIRQNENFALPICHLFESLFRKALFSPLANGQDKYNEKFKDEEQGKKLRYELNRKVGSTEVDYTPFWNAIFHQDSRVFEKLLRNYLIKIKLQHLDESNSGFRSGILINLLLEKSQTHENLIKFASKMHQTCKEHLKFLCKVIIQSHAWARNDLKIYLQNYESE